MITNDSTAVPDPLPEWREPDNFLMRFLDACCQVETKQRVPCSTLQAAYRAWCVRNHEPYPVGPTALHERLAVRFKTVGKRPRQSWIGLGLRGDQK